MSKLFSPFALRDLTLRNRAVVAPMCQYSAVDGLANDWHMVHLGRFGIGGFGLVILEATGVSPEARISYADLGLWNDAQIAPLQRINEFLHGQGAATGIQLAHAGRKASTAVGWRHGADKTAPGYTEWTPVAPSAIIHAENAGFTKPAALDAAGLAKVIQDFTDATRRSDAAGFDIIEIHAAHGYLLNQFLSPLANKRTDEYGGSRENRMRFPLQVVDAVRAAWPIGKPLFVRISTSDNAGDAGWQIEDSIVFAKELKARGVDLVHTSSGGFAEGRIKPEPLYQVQFANAVRTGADIATAAVGLIEDPKDAEAVLQSGQADLIALARMALDDPNWPQHAQWTLDAAQDYSLWPAQAGDRIKDRDRALGRHGFAR